MKHCSKCDETKSCDRFSKNLRKEDGLQNHCKDCCNAKHRAYYQSNKSRMRKQMYTRNRARLAENQEKVFNYLLEHPCVDCGHIEPCVTEFDHRNPAEKKGNVSKLLHDGYAWSIVYQEIQKCDVRCANCHRRKTARDQKWFTWRFAQHHGREAQSGCARDS